MKKNKPGGPSHVVLTTHPPKDGKIPKIKWGAKTLKERGPLIASMADHTASNVIGAYSGAYAIYRALSVATPDEQRSDALSVAFRQRGGTWSLDEIRLDSPYLSLRGKGKLVVGGTPYCDRLEDDRDRAGRDLRPAAGDRARSLAGRPVRRRRHHPHLPLRGLRLLLLHEPVRALGGFEVDDRGAVPDPGR